MGARRRAVGFQLLPAQHRSVAALARAARTSISAVIVAAVVEEDQRRSLIPFGPRPRPRAYARNGEAFTHTTAYFSHDAGLALRRLCISYRMNEAQVIRVALAARAGWKDEDDHGNEDRVDAQAAP